MPILSLTSGLFINFDKVQTITREGADDAAVYVIEFENGKRETFLGEDAKDLRLILQQCIDLREQLRNPPPARRGWGETRPDPIEGLKDFAAELSQTEADIPPLTNNQTAEATLPLVTDPPDDIPPLNDEEKARTEAAAAALQQTSPADPSTVVVKDAGPADAANNPA